MKSYQSKRKFYNKWLYKVTVSVKNAYLFRKNAERSVLNPARMDSHTKDLSDALQKINNYQLRIENKFIDIYLNDKQAYQFLLDRFVNHIIHSFYPHPSLLLDDFNGKTIIANKLPYDKYRYKVFLKPHTISSIEEKNEYIKWLAFQDPKIYITKNTKDWFIKTSWNWDRRYVYVEDEKTLLLLKMRNSCAMGSIYTYRV